MAAKSSLTEGSIWRVLVRLSVPIVLANILQSAYQLTDAFWVGRLSVQALAAVSLSFPLNFLLISIGGGLPIAGTVLIAQYRGRGDQSAQSHVAAQTLILVVVVSSLLAIIGYAFAWPVMRFQGADPAVLPDAVRFLQVTLLGFVFVFGFMAYQALVRGLGVVYTPMFIVLLTVLLNFALDPLFIFGWGPIPAHGVAGAAWATLCTQALAMLIGLVLLAQGKHGIRLHVGDFRPDFSFIRRVFRIGMPASIEQSTQAMGLVVMMLLVSEFGTATQAAYGIGVRIISSAIIPAMGLSMATSTLVGQNIGAGRLDRAEETNRISCLITVAILFVEGLLLFLFAQPLALFFAPEGGRAIEESAEFIRIIAFTFGLIGWQQVLTGTLRGAGDTVGPMVLAIVGLWIFRFPVAYALSQHTALGVRGIWWSFSVSNVLTGVVTWLWFARGKWKERRLIEEEVQLEQRVRDETVIEEGLPF